MSFEGGGGGGIDRSPSNLHWKKELTQIRKAARGLRDPGTSSSWWSSPPPPPPPPPPPQRQIKNGRLEGNVGSSSEHILQVGTNSMSNNGEERERERDREREGERRRRRRVYLCNWRSQKSESERSRKIDDGEDGECGKDEGSSSTLEEIFEVDRNYFEHNHKSDGYLSDMFTAAFFKCMNSSITPSIRHNRKKKSKGSSYSSPSSRKMKILLSRYTKNAVDDSPSVRLGREDLLSLIDQSDDYCNSEDLGRDSSISHLLARIKSKGRVKMMRGSRRKEDDSASCSTRALSTRSYNRYGIRNHGTVELWDATTGSLHYGDDEVDLPGREGCGIPCYWSRRSTPKSRNGSYCSPSLPDTLRRKGSSLFCGSQTMSRRRLSSKKADQSLVPLLGNGADGLGGSSVRSRGSDDELLSAKLAELDLEALRRRWLSSCRSREGLDLVAMNGEVRNEGSSETIRSLSHKYRPTCFEDLIGQNIVVQSLMNAVSRGRIAPVYLFQGPRGVGKTSMARTFASALNCLATEDSKPCGVCRECADSISGRSKFLEEVDGSNKKGVDRLKNLLRNISVVRPFAVPHYKVIVIDQCHLLPSKAWLEFLRLLHEPLPFIIFILVTTDVDSVPRTILTRCQRHILNKIGNGDIVTRLRKISISENFDVEPNALELIALSADGSLRDAETTLDQLSLFGKRITKSMVNELMGVVSEDKLLELLVVAMSSNATETVRRSREVMDSGVDPLVLISQLVTLIVDIIAGTHPSVDAKYNDSSSRGRTLPEKELHRLKHALTLLSEAEKHLRVSSERSTWFTATLLQLGSMPSPDRTQSTSSRQRASRTTNEDHVSMLGEAAAPELNTDENFAPEKSGSTSKVGVAPNTKQSQFNDGKSSTVSHGRTPLTCVDSEMLISIWLLCIEKCRSKTLRRLLHSYGKLVSISETKGEFIADIAFEDGYIKERAEGFLSSITNSFEVVLRHNVKVKLSLLQDDSSDHKLINENKSTCSKATEGNSELDLHQDFSNISRESFDVSKSHQKKCKESVSGNASMSMEDSKSGCTLRRIESIVYEQGLKTASLRSMSRSRPERNQVLPQDYIDHQNEPESTSYMDAPLQHWGDELNHETRTLKMNDGMAPRKDRDVQKTDHGPISPSSLHNSTFGNSFCKDDMGYESGTGGGGCSGMFCWNNRRPQRRGKAKRGSSRHAAKRGRRFSLFGECAKSRTDNRDSR